MRKVFGFLSVMIVLLTACAAQKRSGAADDVTYVQMWRTSCFGKCPNYKVEIYHDGLVRYTGYQFTDTGIYEKNIGAAKAKQILSNFTVNRVDTLQKEYRMMVADLPGINYTFRFDNREQIVRNAEFGPIFLRELANRIDELVKQEENSAPKIDGTWKKISDNPKGD